jgi:hypothetical protein
VVEAPVVASVSEHDISGSKEGLTFPFAADRSVRFALDVVVAPIAVNLLLVAAAVADDRQLSRVCPTIENALRALLIAALAAFVPLARAVRNVPQFLMRQTPLVRWRCSLARALL